MKKLRWLLGMSVIVGCGNVRTAAPAEGGAGIGVAMADAAEHAEGFALVTNDADTVRVAVFAPKGDRLVDVALCEGEGWRAPAGCPVSTRAADPAGMLLLAAPIVGDDPCASPLLLQVHATFSSGATAYAGTFKGRVAYGLHCAPEEPRRGCVQGAGEWASGGTAWPVHGMVLGGIAYPETALREVLAMPDDGDASVMVAKALVAARLNVASGAETEGVVEEAMIGADAWLTENASGKRAPFGPDVAAEGAENGPEWDEGADLAAVMERFDEGGLGNEVCP